MCILFFISIDENIRFFGLRYLLFDMWPTTWRVFDNISKYLLFQSPFSAKWADYRALRADWDGRFNFPTIILWLWLKKKKPGSAGKRKALSVLHYQNEYHFIAEWYVNLWRPPAASICKSCHIWYLVYSSRWKGKLIFLQSNWEVRKLIGAHLKYKISGWQQTDEPGIPFWNCKSIFLWHLSDHYVDAIVVNHLV